MDSSIFGISIETFGILCGFAAAFSQALNYTFSKDCQEKYSLHGFRQLVAVHVFMFILSLIPFAFMGFYKYLSLELLWYETLVIAPYLCAQYIMIKVFDANDASIVSPLMTMKIPILALISIIFMGKEFGVLQVFSIFIIIGLGLYFSSLSGRARPLLLLVIAFACLLFCLSDIAMTSLTYKIGLPRFEAVRVGAVYEYLFCGFLAVPFMYKAKITLKSAWHAKWVAITWYFCTLTFIVTFNVNGVVEGNIIQTLRSVIGVLIAYIFYRKYIKDRNTFRKKLFITAGMFAAVTLYYA